MSLGLVSLGGLLLFVWPFLGLGVAPEAPALAVTVALLGALGLMEIGARRLDAGRLALLATLAALDAGLRLAMVVGIGGFSPIFFLIMVAGYVFGPSYGFLVGSFSLLASALATGGLGPWLPYETFAAGWVGVVAGAAGLLVARRRSAGGEHPERRGARSVDRADLGTLVLVAVLTGFAYGALTDVWEWATYYRGAPGLGWLPGAPPFDTLARFGRFYLATSLGWDAFRAVGDSLAVLAFGAPVIGGLARLRARLGFEVVPVQPAGHPADPPDLHPEDPPDLQPADPPDLHPEAAVSALALGPPSRPEAADERPPSRSEPVPG